MFRVCGSKFQYFTHIHIFPTWYFLAVCSFLVFLVFFSFTLPPKLQTAKLTSAFRFRGVSWRISLKPKVLRLSTTARRIRRGLVLHLWLQESFVVLFLLGDLVRRCFIRSGRWRSPRVGPSGLGVTMWSLTVLGLQAQQASGFFWGVEKLGVGIDPGRWGVQGGWYYR